MKKEKWFPFFYKTLPDISKKVLIKLNNFVYDNDFLGHEVHMFISMYGSSKTLWWKYK